MLWRVLAVFLVLFLVACDVSTNVDRTPTIQPSPTEDETQIALLWTDTPSPSPTFTRTPSSTPTASPSSTPTRTDTPQPSITFSPTATVTRTLTPTVTASSTVRPTNTSTVTHTPSPTRTASSTATRTVTSTTAPSSTPSVTASVTDTRTPTITATSTATSTPTASQTPRATSTNTPRPTQTRTPTITPTLTPSLTLTASNTPTVTPLPTIGRTNTPTRTLSPTPTNTFTPTATGTSTPSATFTATLIPSPSATFTVFAPPTAVSTPTRGTGSPQPSISTLTITPFPTPDDGNISGTPGTPIPFASPTDSQLFPSPLPPILPTFTPFGFVPPGSVAPSNVLISGVDGSYTSLGTGELQNNGALAFDIGPQGQRADFLVNNQFYINGNQLLTSPSSEFGMPAHKQVTEIKWSPDGRYVAFIVSGLLPDEFEYGVWVFDTATNTAHQIMKNDFAYREAAHIFWSPNSTAVLIQIRTDNGFTHTFLPVYHNVNNGYIEHPYSDATWALDSASIIVSGRVTNGQIVFGRVLLDQTQTFVPITYSTPDLVFVYAAIQLPSGQLAFLGSNGANGPYTFYLMPPNGTPQAISNTGIAGQIISWEWNDARTALLLVVDTGIERQAWIVQSHGASQSITPPGGVTGAVRWR